VRSGAGAGHPADVPFGADEACTCVAAHSVEDGCMGGTNDGGLLAGLNRLGSRLATRTDPDQAWKRAVTRIRALTRLSGSGARVGAAVSPRALAPRAHAAGAARGTPCVRARVRALARAPVLGVPRTRAVRVMQDRCPLHALPAFSLYSRYRPETSARPRARHGQCS
jgi:hypothetical protein